MWHFIRVLKIKSVIVGTAEINDELNWIIKFLIVHIKSYIKNVSLSKKIYHLNRNFCFNLNRCFFHCCFVFFTFPYFTLPMGTSRPVSSRARPMFLTLDLHHIQTHAKKKKVKLWVSQFYFCYKKHARYALQLHFSVQFLPWHVYA